MTKISLRAPATVANLSCGFDILGICLKEPYDEIVITKNSDKNVLIEIQDSEFSNIPSNPNENTGGIPAQLIINDYHLDFGFNIKIKKGIPLCGGLGSSAATAAGVVYGINKLLDLKMPLDQLIKYSLEGEKLSSEDVVSLTNRVSDDINNNKLLILIIFYPFIANRFYIFFGLLVNKGQPFPFFHLEQAKLYAMLQGAESLYYRSWSIMHPKL